ncbi:PREDICTED: protein IQ-DOMAIN 14-like isoform X2 [Ipomoea nil]|uniref:protein IQ-DOMAIN 14-like isoform X2 n=1 Tax=Ipomoea nil TaxID=35883 RepID=UPI000900989C|nr:PREDICTED: protein IQ-DOMAIN 14-like isoform X2 [Ipomoea nil]
MGKKGSWFSAIKRVFVPNSSSKDKQINGTEKKAPQEKKKGRRILKRGEIKSFLFREPSSIEKILEEADEQNLLVPLYYEQQKDAAFARPTSPRLSPSRASSCRAASPRYSPPRVASPRGGPLKVSSPRAASPRAISPRAASPRAISPRAASPRAISPRAASPRAISPRATSPRVSPPRVTSPKVASSKVNQNRKETSYTHRPEPTLQVLHFSATRIQAIFRGYMARKNFRSLRGLLRLQAVVKSNSVKRQTANAMKQLQLLVRVQTQIRSGRIQMLENQALQWQAYKNDKDGESTLSKWSQMSEAGNEKWDDSMLTKDETDQRWRKKVEAVMKRERALAYAYSHKLWKANPKNIQSNGFPCWWKWLERQPPSASCSESPSAVKNVPRTPSSAISDRKKGSPLLQTPNYRYPSSEYDNLESETPTSTKSAIPMRARPFHTPGRTPPNSILRKYTRARSNATGSPFQFPLKDDDSLTSCPPFSAPSYMAPTISAKAKARPNANPREGEFGTPSSGAARRLTFPFTPNIGSFKWNKGSNKDAASLREFDRSADGMSVDSTVSMPAIVGRKPFNRFV